MSTYTQTNAVEEIPAAFVAVPAALADISMATAHRDRAYGTTGPAPAAVRAGWPTIVFERINRDRRSEWLRAHLAGAACKQLCVPIHPVRRHWQNAVKLQCESMRFPPSASTASPNNRECSRSSPNQKSTIRRIWGDEPRKRSASFAIKDAGPPPSPS